MQELDQVPKELITELQTVFYPGPHIIDNALRSDRSIHGK